MLRYKILLHKDEIHQKLLYFSVCFPHLHEKINDLYLYAEKLSKNAVVCIQSCDYKEIGLLVYYANDISTKVGYISLIGVLPQYRGMGYGKRLLDFILRDMALCGMKRVRLEVDKDNSVAIAFYERAGFIKESEKAKSFYMIKTI